MCGAVQDKLYGELHLIEMYSYIFCLLLWDTCLFLICLGVVGQWCGLWEFINDSTSDSTESLCGNTDFWFSKFHWVMLQGMRMHEIVEIICSPLQLSCGLNKHVWQQLTNVTTYWIMLKTKEMGIAASLK